MSSAQGSSALQGAASGATAGAAFGPWGAAIGGAVGLAGGLMSGRAAEKSAAKQNAMNIALQRETNQFNAKEAEKNRMFQSSMSNTAHQREVQDLRRAGLNPLLSATGGAGSSTPSGAAATGGAATVEDVYQKRAASALEMANLANQLAQAKANIDLTKAQTAKTTVDTQVATKGIPEADIKNRMYNEIVRPVLDKLQGAKQTGSKIWNNMKRDYNNAYPSHPPVKHNYPRK